MLNSIMTSRGQITIPIEIREELALASGSKFGFIVREGQIVITPMNKSVKNLKGMLPKPKVSLSCEEMNNIIRNRGE